MFKIQNTARLVIKILVIVIYLCLRFVVWDLSEFAFPDCFLGRL